ATTQISPLSLHDALPISSLTKLTAQIRFKPISPNLFNTIAENAAKEVANSASNKPTQLRRFYDELCLWELRVAQEPAKFSEYLRSEEHTSELQSRENLVC